MKYDFLKELEVLGLGQQATREEIEQAYLGQVKRWHPDRFMNDECRRREAEQRLKALNNAYVCLKNFQPLPKTPASPQPEPEQGEAKASRDRSREPARAAGPSVFRASLKEWRESQKRLKVESKAPPEKAHWTAELLWGRILGEGFGLLLLSATAFATWKWIVPLLLAPRDFTMAEWIALFRAGGEFLGGASVVIFLLWVLFSSEASKNDAKPRRKKSQASECSANPPPQQTGSTSLPKQGRVALTKTRTANALASRHIAKNERRIRGVS